jgi:hypothetical protein
VRGCLGVFSLLSFCACDAFNGMTRVVSGTNGIKLRWKAPIAGPGADFRVGHIHGRVHVHGGGADQGGDQLLPAHNPPRVHHGQVPAHFKPTLFCYVSSYYVADNICRQAVHLGLADISRLTTYPRIRARQSYFDAASTVSPALLTGTPKEGDPAYVLPEPAGRGLHPLTFQLNSSRF